MPGIKLKFDQLISVLKQRFDYLPDTDLVAGQAVASAAYEILRLPIKGRYRDLDVFLFSCNGPKYTTAATSLKKTHDRKSLSKGTSKARIKINNYRRPVGIFSKDEYYVTGACIDSKHPHINYVFCEVMNYPSRAGAITTILNGFDLNLVQIGIDMCTHTVYWTDAFAEFCASRRILVKYFGTPMHTLCRLHEKQATMALPADPESEAKLASIRQIMASYENYNNAVLPGNLFSDYYRKRFEQLPPNVHEKWRVESVEVTRKNNTWTFYRINPRHHQCRLANFISRYPHVFLRAGKFDELPSGSFALLYDIFSGVKSKDKEHQAVLLESLVSLYNESNLDAIRLVLYDCLARDRLSDMNPQSIKNYVRVASQHPELREILIELETGTLIQALTLIKWLQKKNKNLIIGKLEVGEIAIDEAVVKGRSFLLNWYHDYLDKLDSDRVTPLFGTKIVNGIKFTEIVNHKELVLLGEREHHCVGGYWSQIESAELMVIELTSSLGRSTLGITAKKSSDRPHSAELKIKEHKSCNNTNPPQVHIEASETFIKEFAPFSLADPFAGDDIPF